MNSSNSDVNNSININKMCVVWKYAIVSRNITLILLNDGIQNSSTNKHDYIPLTDHWFCVFLVSVL